MRAACPDPRPAALGNSPTASRAPKRCMRSGSAFLSCPPRCICSRRTLDSAWRCKGVMSHVEPSKLGQQGVYRIGEGQYVVSPAEVFLQLATVLPFPNLLEVGFELCGRYARPIGGYLELGRRDPLASAAGLDRFLERMAGVPGASTARRAVCFILDGSWSPMETSSVLYLCLPFRLGGYGLPAPLIMPSFPCPTKIAPMWGRASTDAPLLAGGTFRHRVRQQPASHGGRAHRLRTPVAARTWPTWGLKLRR